MQFIAEFVTGVSGVGYCEISGFFCSESMPCAYNIASRYSTHLLWLMHKIVMHICYVCLLHHSPGWTDRQLYLCLSHSSILYKDDY